MTDDVRREAVKVGLDFRPVPIDLGDGNVWNFDPDPEPARFNDMMKAIRGVGASGKALEKNDEAADTNQLVTTMAALKDAVGACLVDDKQREKWSKKSYGLKTMTALVNAYSQEISGFTPPSSKGSGKG